MRRLAHILGLISALLFSLYAKPLVFIPAPYAQKEDLFEDFSPMLRYVEERLHTPITFQYEERYSNLIESFLQNKIDIAYLGPLALHRLMEKCPTALPLISFNENNGTSNERCVLVEFPEDSIDFKHPETITVALPPTLVYVRVCYERYIAHNICQSTIKIDALSLCP